MQKAIIVDLDGTLANCDHRRQYLFEKPKNWKAFHAGVDKDSVNEWCRRIVMRFCDHYDIIIVSGRVAENRQATAEWLRLHNITSDLLFLRKPNDYRDDTIIKKEIYDEHIKGKYEILFVIDDRKRIVDMWRAEGLTVLQCAEGRVRVKPVEKAATYKKYLKELSNAVLMFLRESDKIMRQPASAEKGRRMAALMNCLEIANDSARYSALGVNFRNDKKALLK